MQDSCVIGASHNRRIGWLLAVCLLSSNTLANSGEVQDRNVIAKWQYQPLSSSPDDQGLGSLDLFIEDAVTRKPMPYQTVQLAAWLQPNRNALSDSEPACGDKLRMLVSQGIGQRAEIDLNSWRLLTVNTDRTLTFINPFVGINNAKLESIISLPGDINSWLMQPKRLQLWIHVREGEQSRLISVDTQRRKIVRNIDSPMGAAKLALDADGQHVWLLSTQAGQLGVLDGGQEDSQLKTVSVKGIAGLLPAIDNGVFVWNTDTPKLELWQATAELKSQSARSWSLPAPVRAAGWSVQAERLLLALSDGTLAWIDPGKPNHTVERIVAAGPAGTRLSDFALFDDGRRLLWLDAQAARAGVVDVASGRELLRVNVVSGVDSIAFSEGFAYLHSSAQSRASLLALADLRAGRAQPVEITTGQPTDATSNGQRVVADPSGHGMLIANPRDGVIYQYAEGMMAPMGNYSNYRRSAVGIMVLDAGWTQIGPGHFRASVRNQHGGAHELIIGGAEPRFAACARLDLPAPADTVPASAEKSLPIKATMAELRADDPAESFTRKVRVRLEKPDPSGQSQPLTGVQDLTLLVFDRRTAWQERFHMQEAEPGWYNGEVHLPRGGRYEWQVRSIERELSYQEGHLGSHEVAAR